jgi:hypothetical protein
MKEKDEKTESEEITEFLYLFFVNCWLHLFMFALVWLRFVCLFIVYLVGFFCCCFSCVCWGFFVFFFFLSLFYYCKQAKIKRSKPNNEGKRWKDRIRRNHWIFNCAIFFLFLIMASVTLYHICYGYYVPFVPFSFYWGSCYLIFSFMCMFYRSLFFLLYFFFYPLCCLFFFDIQILITPLVSSNSSFYKNIVLI